MNRFKSWRTEAGRMSDTFWQSSGWMEVLILMMEMMEGDQNRCSLRSFCMICY